MSQIKDDNLLEVWLSGGLDLTERLYGAEESADGSDGSAAPAASADPYTPRHKEETLLRSLHRWGIFYNVAVTVMCLLFTAMMLLAVSELPPFAATDSPAVNEVAERYVEQGTAETGAVNTVAGLILDYRAFDTLGESFVLFTAVCAVTILMNMPQSPRHRHRRAERVRYADDDIIRIVCTFLIPVILIFGVYVLLNGHLSPGGGFSGGAILASAFIIYAMVWGEDKAAAVMTPKRIRTVVLCSLGFYCVAKSYSFFTGANHLHSIISAGVPGRILSAGLILPLNVAVGLVVCCTMYSFYMYFKRGEL